MPQNKKLSKLFVRVDSHAKDLINLFIDSLNVKKTVYLVFHNGQSNENPHFHWLVELKDEISVQTLRNRIKKHFNLSKKNDIGIVEWKNDNEEVFTYPYHEPNAEFLINNLSEVQKEQGIKVNNKKVKKPKAKTQWDIIDDIRLTIGDEKDNFVIWKAMLKALEDNKIRTSIFDLERWFISIKRVQEEESNALFKKILNKLYS